MLSQKKPDLETTPFCERNERSARGESDERRDTTHRVLVEAIEEDGSMAASAAEFERLDVLEALSVRDLRLERLEVVLGKIDRRRLVAGDVEACRRRRLSSRLTTSTVACTYLGTRRDEPSPFPRWARRDARWVGGPGCRGRPRSLRGETGQLSVLDMHLIVSHSPILSAEPCLLTSSGW